MIRNKLVVAALLLTILTEVAVAAEDSEHQSKNAQKVLVILDSVGFNDPDLKEFVAKVDSHIDDGYLNLSEDRAMGGKIELRYQLDGKVSTREMQLTYTPDNSHIECAASVRNISINYRLRF